MALIKTYGRFYLNISAFRKFNPIHSAVCSALKMKRNYSTLTRNLNLLSDVKIMKFNPLLKSDRLAGLNESNLYRRNLLFVRYYAKKKDKGGKKAKKVTLSAEELSEIINHDKMIVEMDHVIELLKQDYIRQLSVRSNLGSFETLTVETEDGKFPLKQIAQILQKSPSLIAINVGAMSQYLPAVKSALEKSGMNINPQQDKTSIFVPLPKVTREHRESLAKSAKSLNDRYKIKLKDVHNKYQRDAKKASGVSDDLVHNVVELIHEKLHEYQSVCDDLMKRKQDELLLNK